jgi:hypothetical protein
MTPGVSWNSVFEFSGAPEHAYRVPWKRVDTGRQTYVGIFQSYLGCADAAIASAPGQPYVEASTVLLNRRRTGNAVPPPAGANRQLYPQL